MDETPTASGVVDRQLVQRYLDGDLHAAAELVDRYQRPLFNVALRMLGNARCARSGR